MYNREPLHLISPALIRRTCRSSSYDRAGGNVDFRRIPANGHITIFQAEGPGIVTHLWFALGHFDYNYLRRLVIKAWWDDAEAPSINVPLGDFFGVGHAVSNAYQSSLTHMVRGTGKRGGNTGVNAWFTMPFTRNARIEVHNESSIPCQACYYMVDWLQTQPAATDGAGYFHALWRRENPTIATDPSRFNHQISLGRCGLNTTGEDNYLVADIHGQGRFIGMNYSVDNIVGRMLGHNISAFGEGDEMIFIDDDTWPPSLHGTGTEDYFLDAWGMTGSPNLYAGTSLHVSLDKELRQRGTCYRYHVNDPVYFRERLRFTFETGHDNCQANDIASTAFWYQETPAAIDLQPVEQRLPRHFPGDPDPQEEAKVVELLGNAIDLWYDIFIDGTPDQVAKLGAPAYREAFGSFSTLRNQFQDGEVDAGTIAKTIEPHRELIAALAGEVTV